MYFNKTANDTIRYVIYDADKNSDCLLVEVQGKKRALKAAGLPTELYAAQPGQSRWGKVITLEQAKNALKIGAKNYAVIMSAIDSHRLVADRVKEIEAAGISVDEFPMGSGGVRQIKEMRDHYRVQVGFGVSNHNYAQAAIIQK